LYSTIDETDCGVAALAMLFKYYGTEISLAKLRNLAKTDQTGTTALGIVQTAEKYNFETKAIKADMSLFDIKELPLPFIVHVIKNKTLEHYYVVIEGTKKYIKIADPDPTVGIIKMSRKKFEQEWTGAAIFIAPKSSYEPVKEKRSSMLSFIPGLLKQKKLIINITMAALLTTLISIVGSYFLQTTIDTYIPNNMQNTLTVVALGLIVFYGFQAVFTYAKDFLLAILGQRKIIDALASSVLSVLIDVGTVIVMGIILSLQ
ncbi:uncharacterized protein LOC116415424, partial [Apis florea]|uniref:uncharacterized protein LOC116415424 n=1 Tax=Apis florea TaxID=7463 RepID=UPI0012FF3AD1